MGPTVERRPAVEAELRMEKLRITSEMRSNAKRPLQSTVDSFTERSADAVAFAAGLVEEPEVDDLTNEGDTTPKAPLLSAGAAWTSNLEGSRL